MKFMTSTFLPLLRSCCWVKWDVISLSFIIWGSFWRLTHTLAQNTHTLVFFPLRTAMKRQPWHKVRNCTTLNHFPLFHWYSHANTSHDFAKFIKKSFRNRKNLFAVSIVLISIMVFWGYSRSETLKVRKKEGSVNVWILVDNWEQIQRCRFYDNLSWKCHHILLLSN